MMMRVLKWFGGVVLLLVLAGALAFYTAFGSNKPIEDGSEPATGVRTVKDGFVSTFVLDAGGGKVVLIDAGNDRKGQAILAELTRRGLGPSAVAGIFLTHGHGDHTAGCALFPGTTVYAMEEELATVGKACRVDHPLKDGEVVTINDLRVEAFAVPGHTPGSAVYFARNVLFFGDSAGAAKDGTVMHAVTLFSSNVAQNVSSLKALEARMEPHATEVTALAFAHTGWLAGLGPLREFAQKN